MNALNNNTAAQSEVTTTELGLSDTELDAVSGGDVKPGMVLASIFTLGIACAAVSAIQGLTKNDCGATFHN